MLFPFPANVCFRPRREQSYRYLCAISAASAPTVLRRPSTFIVVRCNVFPSRHTSDLQFMILRRPPPPPLYFPRCNMADQTTDSKRCLAQRRRRECECDAREMCKLLTRWSFVVHVSFSTTDRSTACPALLLPTHPRRPFPSLSAPPTVQYAGQTTGSQRS